MRIVSNDKPATGIIYRSILLFLLFFCFFYAGGYAIIGLSAPTGYYSPFIAKHLNIMQWQGDALLKCSSTLLEWIGMPNTISGNMLYVTNGITVQLNTGCLGIGLFSMWWAFVLAFPANRGTKIRYFILGTVLIFVLNSMRIAAVGWAYTRFRHNPTLRQVDHHMVFNIMMYILLFLMMRSWINHSASKYKTMLPGNTNRSETTKA